jgi:hypothetical protein
MFFGLIHGGGEIQMQTYNLWSSRHGRLLSLQNKKAGCEQRAKQKCCDKRTVIYFSFFSSPGHKEKGEMYSLHYE